MAQRSGSRLQALRDELVDALQGSAAASAGDSQLFAATVAGVSGSDVVVELGPRVQGVIPLAEFGEEPVVGTGLKAALRGREEGLWLLSIQDAKALASWEEMEVGSLVKGRVIGINKGGLELEVGAANAFLPASQIALHHVEELADYAGETLVCEVLEIDLDRRRVVVSRRAVLEEERRRGREEALGTLAAGNVVRGKVTRIESYGAFVEVGAGLEGLLHVSNLAHRRVDHPGELLKTGQVLKVLVLEVAEGGKRIGLGRKQLEADPWDGAAERYRAGLIVTGRVRRLVDFGAFVELEPGLEGLLHVSQLGVGREKRPSGVLKPGEEIALRVLTVDEPARRLSLSRLDARGALLGSEEAAAGEEIDAVLEQGGSLGTNLGALFERALKKNPGPGPRPPVQE